ncbi:hypothetical protein SAMN06265795_10963 [Noviherbaspirillum humi]|uniref:Uncharacterized protein n=2 Tax=Noviherbaspirillum humi TaxID=1688639 RepID=A0A239IEL9_9BURK|nr:hypothetical protein SAMN06265795_10963 [Noviherbaspirillum humi]
MRDRRITDYVFPVSVSRKVKATYPNLDAAQVRMVMKGLREYFLISAAAGGRMVSMPSKAVDVAWHEFIICTRAYQKFCQAVFGRFLHHTPSEAMRRPTMAQDGIKRAWRLSCGRENIDPRRPDRLPLLFAIDERLQIADGYRYALDCSQKGNVAYGDIYCASHIGCGGGCAGWSTDADSGCSSDSGCGGGCGGGGD